MIDLSHYRRGRGCPKMSWNEVIRSDMKFMGLTEDMAQDRICGDLGLKLLTIRNAYRKEV